MITKKNKNMNLVNYYYRFTQIENIIVISLFTPTASHAILKKKKLTLFVCIVSIVADLLTTRTVCMNVPGVVFPALHFLHVSLIKHTIQVISSLVET